MSSRRRILLVDDDPAIGRAMTILFEMAGYALDVATTPDEAYSRLAAARYDAILLDLNFTAGRTGGDEGLACLDRMMSDDPSACVVVITAHSGIRIAVAAMQAGARDFIMKPWRNAELLAKVEAATARIALRTPPEPLRASSAATGIASLLGDSPAIGRVRDLVRRMGPTEAGVAITGPPGSGRGLVASALHAASRDVRPARLIDLRDDAMWKQLDAADGTVVLRHVDRLDDLAQSRLLARLHPATRTIAIADSLRDLSPALRSRSATVEIAVPPLRQRGDDALLLARHFGRIAAERHGRARPHFTPAAEALILAMPWPDEVRGLALAVERAVLLATDAVIDAAAFAPPAIADARVTAPPAFDLSDTEKAVIAAALREHHHNVTRAAAALGLSRGALYRRMERHGL